MKQKYIYFSLKLSFIFISSKICSTSIKSKKQLKMAQWKLYKLQTIEIQNVMSKNVWIKKKNSQVSKNIYIWSK